jgi:hypothetical protein
MTAAEARAIALEATNRDDSSQYTTIKNMIMEEAGNGNLACWIYNTSIRPAVKAKLEVEGYEVGPTESDRGETLTQIKW